MKYVVAFLSALVLLCVVPSANANFIFRGGYYWRGGVAYNRVAYSCNGCAAYRYVAVSNVSNKVINNYPPKNWKVSVIESLDKQQDLAAYLQALQVLRGNYGGNAQPYGAPSYQLSNAGVSGTTVYSYNGLNPAANVASFYGLLDVNQLLQAKARTTEQALEYGNQSEQALSGIAKQVTDAQAAIAIILADAQAKSAVLQAAKSQVTATQTYTTNPPAASPPVVTPAPNPNLPPLPGVPLQKPPPMPPAEDPGAAALKLSVEKNCLSCHNGVKKEGGFDLTKAQISDAEWAKVIERVHSKDPNKVMPRGSDGKGKPLPQAEQDLYN